MDLDLRRNLHDTDQFNQHERPPDFSQSKMFSKSCIDTLPAQPSFHRKLNQIRIIDTSVCPYSNSNNCYAPFTCSLYQRF